MIQESRLPSLVIYWCLPGLPRLDPESIIDVLVLCSISHPLFMNSLNNMGQILLQKFLQKVYAREFRPRLNRSCESCNTGSGEIWAISAGKVHSLLPKPQMLLLFFPNACGTSAWTFIHTLGSAIDQEFALWLCQTTVPYPSVSVKATGLAIAFVVAPTLPYKAGS